MVRVIEMGSQKAGQLANTWDALLEHLTATELVTQKVLLWESNWEIT